MKKLFTLLFFVFVFSHSSFSQENGRTFRPFKCIASMGYAKPEKLDHEYALNFSLEPKYGTQDWLWFGLRSEATIFIQQAVLKDDYKATAVFAFSPQVDFSWPLSDQFRPFTGFGAGIYASKQYFDGYEQTVENKVNSNFGFSSRIGFEFQRSTFAFEYNRVVDGINYFTIKIGYCIGGGTVN